MKTLNTIYFIILIPIIISCSSNNTIKLVSDYNELKLDLLNEIITYFDDNKIINTMPYYTLFSYPYYLELELDDIRLERAFIYSISPFESLSSFRSNSLLIYDLDIFNWEDQYLYAIVGVFLRNENSEDRYYSFSFIYLENKWVLTDSKNKKQKNDYFLNSDETVD